MTRCTTVQDWQLTAIVGQPDDSSTEPEQQAGRVVTNFKMCNAIKAINGKKI